MSQYTYKDYLPKSLLDLLNSDYITNVMNNKDVDINIVKQFNKDCISFFNNKGYYPHHNSYIYNYKKRKININTNIICAFNNIVINQKPKFMIMDGRCESDKDRKIFKSSTLIFNKNNELLSIAYFSTQPIQINTQLHEKIAIMNSINFIYQAYLSYEKKINLYSDLMKCKLSSLIGGINKNHKLKSKIIPYETYESSKNQIHRCLLDGICDKIAKETFI